MKRALLYTAAAGVLLLSALAKADEPESGSYKYAFDLTDGLSCSGTSKLNPTEFYAALSMAAAKSGFIQVENYHSASGSDSPIGFVGTRFIVRIHLITPNIQAPKP